MGGFAGGDEAGFWGNDQIARLYGKEQSKSTTDKSTFEIIKDNGNYSAKAHAKVNIFLKIVGYKEGVHLLRSRFIRLPFLYDTITFVPGSFERFTIEGMDEVALENNIIYKAYKLLVDSAGDLDILEFFYNHKVVVDKKIPMQAGLGGGSSDAATFMLMTKALCNLLLQTDELAVLGAKLGADIPFFIYGYESANVSGFGEVIEPFKEESPAFEITVPPIKCDTASVYRRFHQHHLSIHNVDEEVLQKLATMPSKEILETFGDPFFLNDLLKPALECCDSLKEYLKDGWYLSGSGSALFRAKLT